MDRDAYFDLFHSDVLTAITRWLIKAYDMGYAKRTAEVLAGLTHPKHSLSGAQAQPAQQVIFGDVQTGIVVGIDGRDEFGKPGQAVLWSAERDALLSREIGEGLPNTVVQDHLNAMAGGWIDIAALRNRMIYLKVSRPRAKLPEKPKPAPIVAPPERLRPHTAAREKTLVPTPLSLPPPGPDGKIGVTRTELDAWCSKMRMKFDGSNMDRINALRAQLRQPPFVLVS